MTTSNKDTELDNLIENWVMIDVKDADYVVQAKLQARRDFKAAILADYISKSDVIEAIGEDEVNITVKGEKINRHEYKLFLYTRNQLRAEIRKELGL